MNFVNDETITMILNVRRNVDSEKCLCASQYLTV